MKAIAYKGRTAALLLLLAAQLGYAAFLNPHGHFTVDEGVYHMMARALAEEGSLAVWNGYAETPSKELVYTFLRVDRRDPANPRLVPQYPPTYAFIAAPFYLAAGLSGLFYLNLLAFLAAVWLTMAIAQRLFSDRGLTLNAALILIVATFTWEYVHAIWPHVLAMAFTTGAMLAAIVSFQTEDRWRTAAYAAIAGLTLGIGSGVRYDTILLAPALVLPFLFASPVRLAPAVSLSAGLIPGLLLLAISNAAKFGILSPFTYGSSRIGEATVVSTYLNLVVLAGAAVAAIWLATRPKVAAALTRYRWWPIAIAVALTAVVLAMPPLQSLALRMADGTWQLVVDMRIRSLDIVEWGVSRTPGGAVAYDQALKKSLLQNCPWLIVLLLPLARFLRQPRGNGALSPMFLAIAGFLAFYAYFAWHGGYSFNMRYFVSVLPFAAVLGAYGWRCLAGDLPPNWRWPLAAAGFSTIVLWFALLLQDPGLGIEPLLLNPPLVLAGVLLVALLVRAASRQRARTISAGLGLTALAMSLSWATTAALLYDLPRSRNTRAESAAIAGAVAPALQTDSLLFSRYASTVSNLISADRVRLAFPRNDDFADFRRLLDLYLDSGRAVYIAFNDEYRHTATQRNLLDGLEIVPLYDADDTFVARIVRAGGS
ncbi:MAG: hypothetical protein JSU82_12565 [Rhodospirillales bacterium]|nr:MAG: hypothetical protein JSU82_12565 [Rhodospirillales bacterium]